MTTIIAIETPEHVTLGWDKQITHGYRRVDGDDKVFVNRGIVFGISGDVLDANIIRYANLPDPALAGWDIDRWVTVDLIPALAAALNAREATSKYNGKLETNSGAIVVVSGRVYLLSSDLSWFRSSDGTYAVGSGGAYALGALHTGASPSDALRIAGRLDVFTGAEHHIETASGLLGVS